MKFITMVFLAFITCLTYAQNSTWTKDKEEEIAGNQSAKFDNDKILDYFKIEANDDALVQRVLSINLSSLKKEIKINLINNSILYNNEESVYSTFFTVNKSKVCEVVIEYMNQKSISNISGEKKDLKEKIKFRFNPKNQKVQVIGYELSYIINSKVVKKSINFLTGKFIATSTKKGKTIKASGWALELENVYIENWNFPFLRDKIFWYGEEVE